MQKYSVGNRFGRATIIEAGPHDTHAPGSAFEHTRALWWYLMQCDCEGEPYWVNQNQLRTHRECRACYLMHAGRPAPPPPREPPKVDFLRIPLRSDQKR